MKHKVWYYLENLWKEKEEEIIEERPLSVYINKDIHRLLLRTPGEDEALLIGICFTEGLIKKKEDILSLKVYKDRAEIEIAAKYKDTDIPKDPDKILNKIIKTSVYADKDRKIKIKQILNCVSILESRQVLREKTKASHGVMLFSYTLEPLSISEDVGRHNAFDKAIGKALIYDRLNDAFIAILSSRISFEMAKKAAMAGIKVLVGISRPTSMAIILGEKLGMSIVSLARDGDIMVYSGKERIEI